jgi:DNA primase catalytic core
MIKNIQPIIENADILSIIRDKAPDVKLEKAGTNWRAKCPFHNEKTESFMVSPKKQIFKCFGCGKAGNVITFLMEYQGTRYTFPQAIEEIAKITKQTIVYEKGLNSSLAKKQAIEKRLAVESLAALLKTSIDFYKQKNPLPDGEIVNIAGREYKKTTAELFGVLPVNTSSDDLAKHAMALKWNIEHLKSLGLIGEKDGKTWDVFRNRTLFPICDKNGIFVALAGRFDNYRKEDTIPKYINSPTSELYKKENILYGLHIAKTSMVEFDRVYLLEGYTDVMTMHENGIKNCVATCGTGLSESQVNILRRYVSEVVIFRDGDEAGLKATQRDVEMILEGGLICKVLICDEGEDQDSLLRKIGNRGFEGFLMKEADGLIWRVMQEWGTDMIQRAAAMQTAVRLLALIDNNISLKEIYLRELCKPETLGSVRKTLEVELALKKKTLKNEKENKKNLSIQQETDLLRYGIFEKDNAFWTEDRPGQYRQITNFVIVPQYHIKDKHNPTRIIQLKHQSGTTDFINMATDHFVCFTDFKKILASLGKYRFEVYAKNEDFLKVISFVNDEMPSAYRINTLGRHYSKSFYTFCNGIVTDTEKFYQSNNIGLVEYEGTQFLIPGFDSLIQDENIDETENNNEYVSLFRYNDGQCEDLEKISSLWIEAYGDNGKMGFAWYLASLYRDYIYQQMTPPSFPLLYCFGKKGSGKSTMLYSLSYMFGQARKPFTLGESTYKSFFRRLMQVSNAVITADEYSKNLDEFWQRAIMGAFGGAGRDISEKNDRTSTVSTAVKAALAYAGQDMPLYKDGALFSRSCILQFNGDHTPESANALKMLQTIERTGQLSQHTGKLQKHWEEIKRLFNVTLEEIRSETTNLLPIKKIEKRIVNNHCIPLTILKILSYKEKLAIDYNDLVQVVLRMLEVQVNSLSISDDIGKFWQMVSYMSDNHILRHNIDLIVEKTNGLTIRKSRTESKYLNFNDEIKTVIYIRLNNLYVRYAEQMTRLNQEYLDESTLRYYLEKSSSFIGINTKRFDNGIYSAYVFDAGELTNIEITLSKEVR